MIPLYDNNPSRTRPYVNYALIAINVGVFLYELSLNNVELGHFVRAYAVEPRLLFNTIQALQHGKTSAWPGLIPLLTAMFMHGGWLHLGGNMLFLYIFGDNVEDRFGHLGYLIFYLAAGLVAAFAQAFAAPHSLVPSLGASGAIGGVLGAYIVLYPSAEVFTLIFLGIFIATRYIPAWVFLGIWFLLQSVQGVATLHIHSTASAGGIAFWAHVGGFLTGVGVALLFKNKLERNYRSPFADRWYSNR